MRSESHGTRQRVIRGLLGIQDDLGICVVECVDRQARDAERRQRCLAAVLDLCAELRAERLVLELDESIRDADARFLYEQVRARGLASALRYEWLRRNDEPLLWIADVIAWCHNRGGEWIPRVAGLVWRRTRV